MKAEIRALDQIDVLRNCVVELELSGPPLHLPGRQPAHLGRRGVVHETYYFDPDGAGVGVEPRVIPSIPSPCTEQPRRC